MTFRPEIHGLRAVAIGLVVLHHVWFGRISGGIDAFLLIGAFLLTGTFLRRHDRGEDGRPLQVLFSRMLRLVPAAAVTVAAVVLATPFLIPGTRWAAIWQQAVAALTFRQNQVLIDSAVNYYTAASELTSPLQHFWSLSIQGQVIIAFCLGLGAITTIRDGRRMRRVLAVAFGVLFVASFAHGVASTAQAPVAAYFATSGRLWEFALGGLLALAVERWQVGGRAGTVLGALGLMTLLGAAFVLPADVRYPGVVALIPTLATAAVILSGGGGRITRGLLQHRVTGWLAERSYGLFLWHWPLLTFWIIVTDDPSVGVVQGAAVIAASLVLAALTRRFVEVPLRDWRPRFGPLPGWTRDGAVAGVTLVLVVGLVLGVQRWEDAEAARASAQPISANPGARVLEPGYDPADAVPGPLLPLPNRLSAEWAPEIDVCPDYPFGEGVAARCKLFEPEGETTATVAVVGSSHAAQWVGALLPIARDRGWRLLQLEMADCELRGELDDAAADCAAFNREATQKVLDERADAVLTVATRTGWQEPDEIAVPGYAEAVAPFVQAGMTVLAVRDNPRWAKDPAECLARYGSDSPLCGAPAEEMLAADSPLAEVTGDPRVVGIDFTDLLCPDGYCPAAIGNVGVYLDTHHLTRSYLQTARPQVEKALDRATGWTVDGPR